MQLKEAKIGMRVGLCQTVLKKLNWSISDREFYTESYSPGKIIDFDHRMILIESLDTGFRCWFLPSALASNE